MGKRVATRSAPILLILLTGCSSPSSLPACPAIAYSTIIAVELSGGGAGAVAAVRVCSQDNECSDGSPVEVPRQASEGARTALPSTAPEAGDPLIGTDLAPSGPISSFTASRLSLGEWEIETAMVLPDSVNVQALDGDSRVVAQVDEVLTWTRISGTEECGGNARSGPVVLTVS